MNCKYQKNIYRLADGELKEADRAQFQKHLQSCPACQKEVESIQKLNAFIQSSAISIEPSANFEGRFWQKILEREKESWLSRVLRDLGALIPAPSFAQALAVLLVALFIGSTGGVVSTMNIITPARLEGERASVKYLSGFQEFKGIPSSSVAASYLKVVEKRNSR